MPTASQSRKPASGRSSSSDRMAPKGPWGLSLGAYEDMLEGQAFSAAQKFQSLTTDTMRQCFERQAEFAMTRWKEDLELVAAITECRDPKDAASTMQDFYARMVDAYRDHFSAQSDLLQTCFTEGLSAAEELRETATDITRAAAETASSAANDAGKPKAA